MQSFKIVFLLSTLFFFQCARPCPADIKLGELNLSTASKSFFPAALQVQEMTFKNATGEKLTFKNNNPDWNKRTQLDVETLCQRGDFLDRTAQSSFFAGESYHLNFDTPNKDYTIEINLTHSNIGTYGKLADTIFYETFTAYGQRLTAPTQVGGTTVLTSLRGNDAKVTPAFIAGVDNFVFVADTTLLGQAIQNVWVTPKGKNWTLFMFYSKEKGIEGFTTENGEVWLRE
jgi:hypothetical protein